MFEICAFLAAKKTPKVRAPRKPSIKVGAEVFVYGHAGVVVGKHPTNANWWNVEVPRRGVSGFHRSVIDIKA